MSSVRNTIIPIRAILAAMFILLLSLTFTCQGKDNGILSIAGKVYIDLNNSGKYDLGEAGIPGCYLYLSNSANVFLKGTNTDFNGTYAFTGLSEGTYIIGRIIDDKDREQRPFKLNSTSAQKALHIDFLVSSAPIEKNDISITEEVKYYIYGFIDFIWPGLVWLAVLIFVALLAVFIVIKLYSMINISLPKKSYPVTHPQEPEKDCFSACNCTILFVLMGTAFLAWTLHIFGRDMYIVPLIGIACLTIPLIMSISSDYNLGSKLDSGEIRKSIVISLTVIYIIFLAISFEKSINEPDTNIQSYNADFAMSMDKQTPKEIGTDSNASPQKQNMRIKANINSSSNAYGIPKNLVANFSGSKAEIVLATAPNASKDSGSVPMPVSTGNASSSNSMIPADVIANFTKNFLYVYIIIILFYFGSRFIDDYRTSSSLKDFMVDEQDLKKAIKARLVLGDIGKREFEEIMDALEERDKPLQAAKDKVIETGTAKDKANKAFEDAKAKADKAMAKKDEADKFSQDAQAKADKATTDKDKADKIFQDAKAEADKAPTDKDKADKATAAKAEADKAAAEKDRADKTLQDAKAEVNRATAEKDKADKALQDAKPEADKATAEKDKADMVLQALQTLQAEAESPAKKALNEKS